MYNTRFVGSWNIEAISALGNVDINAHTVSIDGNLRVTGNVSTINATNTNISDNIITLNSGETGSGVTAIFSGIEIDRGLAPAVRIRWNEATGVWELTNDGSTYRTIFTGVGGTGFISQVVEDPAPSLGGNLDVLNNTIFSSNTALVKIDSNLAIANSTIAPSVQSGYNVIYAQSPNSGGSGIYVTNTVTQQQELVTKSKAIAFSIVFG